MSYSTYAPLPGFGSNPSMPLVSTLVINPVMMPQLTTAPMVTNLVISGFAVNGNGVTLVTGAGAAGGRPAYGQQWARGTHMVLSQFATSYAGVGQR